MNIDTTKYTQIPRDQWLSIKKRSYIRYKKPDGKWTNGGFLQDIWKDPNTDEIKFGLSNGLSPTSLSWNVKSSNIVELWKKNDDTNIISSEEVQENQEITLESLKKEIDFLKKKDDAIVKAINQLASDQKRLTLLISKHLGPKSSS